MSTPIEQDRLSELASAYDAGFEDGRAGTVWVLMSGALIGAGSVALWLTVGQWIVEMLA